MEFHNFTAFKVKKFIPIFILLLLSAVMFQGCRSLNPSLMLRTGKGYQYSQFPASQLVVYKIAPNDILSFQIFSNDGFKLIDVSTI